MSNSNPNTQVALEVRTQDNASEIYVIDGQFHLRQRGWGNLQTSLEPGIYKVKVRAGYETREEHVILRPDAGKQVVNFPALPFSSPVPLSDTAKTHEYHISAAMQHSKQVHVSLGTGSYLFVMAREYTSPNSGTASSPPNPLPAQGLTLCDAGGNLLLDFEKQSVSDATADAWAACNVAVAPGNYRLRLQLPSGETLEQTLAAVPGWQTQVFLLQRDYEEGTNARRADLPGAAILYSKGLTGFAPDERSMRLVELARIGLTNARMVLPDDTVQEILYGKFDNPMLGILGAHLYLSRQKTPAEFLPMVVNNLRLLLGNGHPDVEALALRVEPNSPYRFSVPPMLRRSWALVVSETAQRPELVPRASLASNIASRIWGDEPWLVWMNPANTIPSFGIGLTMAAADAQSDLEAALQQQLLQPGRPSAQSLARRTAALAQPNLSMSAGLESFSMAAPPQEAQADLRSAEVESEPNIERLVRMLGMPRANIEEMLEKIQKSGS